MFDEAYVVSETNKVLEAKGYAGRCVTQAGSFFESVPTGADAYLMKMILHDWNDEKALAILKNCAAAMKEHSKLIVVEIIIPHGNAPHLGKYLDINMLAMTGGKERTEDEFTMLFSKAGLEVKRFIYTHSPMFSIIEAEKKM